MLGPSLGSTYSGKVSVKEVDEYSTPKKQQTKPNISVAGRKQLRLPTLKTASKSVGCKHRLLKRTRCATRGVILANKKTKHIRSKAREALAKPPRAQFARPTRSSTHTTRTFPGESGVRRAQKRSAIGHKQPTVLRTHTRRYDTPGWMSHITSCFCAFVHSRCSHNLASTRKLRYNKTTQLPPNTISTNNRRGDAADAAGGGGAWGQGQKQSRSILGSPVPHELL